VGLRSPNEAVAAFLVLGCTENPRHSRKNYRWLELLDGQGHQKAIFNVPVAKDPIPIGTFVKSILNPNGIRDEVHLKELLEAEDPRAAFLAVLPEGGPRYRPHGH
jgi:hypothetical protein